jgi:uncharacterized protein (TIGR03067 family)
VHLVGLLAAALCGPADFTEQNAIKEEPARLDGTWIIVSAEHDGQKTRPERTRCVKVVIIGEKLTVKGDKGVNSIIKIDPSKAPRHINIMPEDGPDKGKVLQGIYQLQGDSWKLCIGQPGKPRPTEFAAPAHSGHMLIDLKREKP